MSIFFNIEGGLQVFLMFEWCIIYSNLTSVIDLASKNIKNIKNSTSRT